MTREDILALATGDYQHRNGDYSLSEIAESIEVYEKDNCFSIEANFKNTSTSLAKRWIERFAEKNELKVIKAAEACQNGDYYNDLVKAWIIVKGEN